MKSWSVVLLLFCSANLSACSGGNNNGDEGNGSGELPAGNVTVKITPDKKTVLRNPLNGWVIYMGRGWDENFWTTEGYDNVSVPERCREVFIRIREEKQSYTQVAEELGISMNTVDAQLQKAITRLKEMICRAEID